MDLPARPARSSNPLFIRGSDPQQRFASIRPGALLVGSSTVGRARSTPSFLRNKH